MDGFFASGFVAGARRLFLGNTDILQDVASQNLGRLAYIIPIAALVHLLHVILFGMMTPSSDAEALWRAGVIGVHFAGMIGMALFYAVLLGIRRRGQTEGRAARWLPNIIILVVLLEAMALVTFDQYVTSNITPFVVICAIMAVVILIRPWLSITFYLLAYLLFYIGMGLVQQLPEIVLTNRVNGLSAIAVGICASLILWQINKRNVIQQRKITDQQAKLEKMNQELAALSETDELTGLANRRRFNKTLADELARHIRSGEPLSLIMTDIDHFKLYNDLLGHQAGDDCLRRVAAAHRKCAGRPYDLAARYGGEEFTLILPYTHAAGAVRIARVLQDELAARKIFHPAPETQGIVTLSMGIVSLAPTQDVTAEDLIGYADAALYASKSGGRNRFTVSDCRRC
jgi:diguanylate cyclase (GGDEF)-like protein